MQADTREHIISTAESLFYVNGFHATGVDRIAAETGLTKKTLYAHFRSKTELVAACLRHRDQAYLSWLDQEVSARTQAGEPALPAVFDAMENWIEARGQNGCMFLNALSEFGEDTPEVISAAESHKAQLRRYFVSLAERDGSKDPETLGTQIMLLMEGAVGLARSLGASQALKVARSLLPNPKT